MEHRITFINHATVLLELDGKNILTDPVFCFAISYWIPRLRRAGLKLEELPPIDAILLSHNHYDHLNFKSLRALQRRFDPEIVVPQGDGRYARKLGFRHIHEMRWWESISVTGLTVHAVPARHTGGRLPWNKERSLCCGYVVETKNTSVYFAGDTAYDSFFTDIAKKFHLDVALLPIGAYKPHAWFEHIHLNPATAFRAFKETKAKHLIPVHWGTFKISDEPMDEPPRLLLKEASKSVVSNAVHILQNGESFVF